MNPETFWPQTSSINLTTLVSSLSPPPATPVAKTGGRAWNRTGDLVLIRDAL